MDFKQRVENALRELGFSPEALDTEGQDDSVIGAIALRAIQSNLGLVANSLAPSLDIAFGGRLAQLEKKQKKCCQTNSNLRGLL
jgi:hypothetical protein